MTAPRLRLLNVSHIDDLARPRLPGTMESRVPYSANPCSVCPATCCTERVRVLLVEAVRLCNVLGFGIRELVKPMPYESGADHRFLCRSLDLTEGPSLLELRRTERPMRCVFVHTVGTRSFCGVYGVRPAVCRLYPFHLETAAGTELSVGGLRHCPVRWVATNHTVQDLERSVASLERDVALEDQVVTQWDQSKPTDRSLEALVEFVRPAVLAHDGVDPRSVLPPRLPGRVSFGRSLW